MKRHLNVLGCLQGADILPFADELLPFAERAAHEALEALSPTRCAGCERAGALICQDCLGGASRSSTRGIAAPDAAPRLETCCAPSARSRARPRRWPKRSTGAWHVPFTRTRCRGSLKRTRMRASDVWLRIWRSCSTTPPCMPRSRRPIAIGGVLSGADAVVFVPATAAAFRRRGFDHMEAIARPFCELSGVPLLDALVKYGHGDQRELGREERRERARGMYETVEDVRGPAACCLSTTLSPRVRRWPRLRRNSCAPVPRPLMALLSHAFGRGDSVWR